MQEQTRKFLELSKPSHYLIMLHALNALTPFPICQALDFRTEIRVLARHRQATPASQLDEHKFRSSIVTELKLSSV